MESRVFDAAQNGDIDAIGSLYAEKRELLRDVAVEDNNILHIAVREGRSDFVQWIIDNVEGSSSIYSAKNSYGNTPLHEAAYVGDAHLVSILIPFAKYPNDGFIFLAAILSARGEQFDQFLQKNLNPNFQGETPLLIACKYGHRDAARCLLEASTQISVIYPKYQACLHEAAYRGHLDAVRLLLEKSNSEDRNALTRLLIKGNREVRWRDVLFFSDAAGANPLHKSVEGGHIQIVGEILNTPLGSSGIRKSLTRRLMTEKDRLGRCAIHVAAVKGRWDIVEVLMSSMPNSKDIRSADYKTVAHFAVAYNHLQIVQNLLCDTKWVRDDRDKYGNTSLHLAAQNAVDQQLVKHLLSFPGVDVNAVNNEGLTALDVAVAASSNNSTTDIIRILEENGASASHKRLSSHNEVTGSLSKEREENQNKALDLDTLVASLIATVTFSAIFQVPGGIDNDSNSVHYGVAKLAFQPSFFVFILSDTAALFTSLLVVMAWVIRERLSKKTNEVNPKFLIASALSLQISITSTAIAFLSAVHLVIIPPNVKALKTTNKEAFNKYLILCLLVFFVSFYPVMRAVNYLLESRHKDKKSSFFTNLLLNSVNVTVYFFVGIQVYEICMGFK